MRCHEVDDRRTRFRTTSRQDSFTLRVPGRASTFIDELRDTIAEVALTVADEQVNGDVVDERWTIAGP